MSDHDEEVIRAAEERARALTLERCDWAKDHPCSLSRPKCGPCMLVAKILRYSSAAQVEILRKLEQRLLGPVRLWRRASLARRLVGRDPRSHRRDQEGGTMRKLLLLLTSLSLGCALARNPVPKVEVGKLQTVPPGFMLHFAGLGTYGCYPLDAYSDVFVWTPDLTTCLAIWHGGKPTMICGQGGYSMSVGPECP